MAMASHHHHLLLLPTTHQSLLSSSSCQILHRTHHSSAKLVSRQILHRTRHSSAKLVSCKAEIDGAREVVVVDADDVAKLKFNLLILHRTHHHFSTKLVSRKTEIDGSREVVVVDADDVVNLKLNVLSAVSGLNKGLAADEEDLKRADAAAKDLEAAGGLVELSNDLDKLQGRWKLIYSSTFSSRTLGGSRSGPPIGRLLPITLGKVFQRIDILSKDFDNIVELQFGTPWPLPTAEVVATLAHKFELIDMYNMLCLMLEVQLL